MILGVYSGRKNKMVCDSLTGQSQWIFLVSGRKWGIVDKIYQNPNMGYKKIVLDILFDHDKTDRKKWGF